MKMIEGNLEKLVFEDEEPALTLPYGYDSIKRSIGRFVIKDRI